MAGCPLSIKLKSYLNCYVKPMFTSLYVSEGSIGFFMISLLYGMPDYSVKSNREEGNGRTDIVFYPESPKIDCDLGERIIQLGVVLFSQQ